MTLLLFRDDAYRKSCDARVLGINDRGGIILDQTVFYPTAGGQPGDKGTLTVAGSEIAIATTVYDEAKNAVHVPAAPVSLTPGAPVSAALDWDNRYRNMRCHSLMHLLCAAVPYRRAEERQHLHEAGEGVDDERAAKGLDAPFAA
jgi:misacylated tRNA(Ala) deacylase